LKLDNLPGGETLPSPRATVPNFTGIKIDFIK